MNLKIEHIRFLWWAFCPLFLASINSLHAEDEEGVFTLSPFEVSADDDRGYGVTESIGATRQALPNSDISSSVISITSDFMSDVAAISAEEALRFVSGVQNSATDPNPGNARVTLRGYQASVGNYRDGLPDNSGTRDMIGDDSAHYDRLEVIKGPAGVLYGSHTLGGVINKISNRAVTDNFTNLEMQVAGGYEEYIKGVVDVNRKLGENSALRAIVSSRRGNRHWHDTDEGGAEADINGISLIANTYFEGGGRFWGQLYYSNFEIDREYNNQFLAGWKVGLQEGEVPVIDADDDDFLLGKSINKTPKGNLSKGNTYNYEIGFEQPFDMFGSDWTMRTVMRYNLSKGDKSPSIVQFDTAAYDADGVRLGAFSEVSLSDPRIADWKAGYQSRDFRSKSDSGAINIDLAGEFGTESIKHSMVVNLRGGMTERGSSFFRKIPAGRFSLLDGAVEQLTNEELVAGVPNTFIPWQGWNEGDSFSAGVLDNISFFDDKLILAIGSRYDWGRSVSGTYDVDKSLAANEPVEVEEATGRTSGNEFTWKQGVVYKPVEDVSLFAQHATTFNFVSGVDVRTGLPFENQEGVIDEVGVKTTLLDNRFILTASYFDMELTNVTVQVVRPDGSGFDLAQEGVQKTTGVELDLAYLVNENISLIAAVSDVDSKNAVGNYFRGVPRTPTYSFFGRYTFTDGGLKGAFAGLGYKYNGEFSIDNGNNLFAASGGTMDLLVGYRKDNWSLQLNAYNVLGYEGIVSAVNDSAVIRAEDPNYRISATYKF